MARKPQTASTASNGKPSAAAKTNAPDIGVLIADVNKSLDQMKSNDTGNVKLNQRIAWDLLRYRETTTKPVAYDLMRKDSTALTTWRGNMVRLFIGKSPPMSGDITADMRLASKAYRARAAIVGNAATFIVAAGLRGVTSEHFSETLNCFAVPPVMLIPHGYKAEDNLEEALNEGKLVPLDNTSYLMSTRNKEGKRAFREVRASLAQCLAVFNEKPPTPAQTAAEEKAQAAIKGANDKSAIAPAVIASVLKNAGIERLAYAMRDAFNADNSVPHKRTDFDPPVWDALMNVARRIMSIASLESAAADAKPANGSKVAA